MPVTPALRTLDEPAITDEAIVKECATRLKIAMESESENRAMAIDSLEFGNGKQWPDDLYNRRRIDKRPSLTINHTNTFIKRVVNNMRLQRPRIKVHAVGEGATKDVADVVAGVIRHIEARSNASIAYDTAGESAVRMGWGYWRVFSEWSDEGSFDQELRISPIRNPFTVYGDPAAVDPAGSDFQWAIITEKMDRQEFRRKYPDMQLVAFSSGAAGDDLADWESNTEIRLAEYYRIKKVPDRLHRMSNGMTLYGSDLRKFKEQLDQQKIESVHSRASYRQRVEWFRINGSEIVDRRTADKDPLPDKYIPVIRCEGNVLEINGRVIRKGMTPDLMDPARMYNYWRTCETEQIALATKSPWLVAEGQTDGHAEWDTANTAPHSKLTWKPTTIEQPDGSLTPLPPPQQIQGPQVSAGFVQAAQGAMQDLMATAGMPHDRAADQPGAVISGKALRERAAMSDIGHFQFYDNQTRSISHTGTILLSLIPHYYSTERLQRIIGEDGVPSMVTINQQQPQGAPQGAPQGQPGQPQQGGPQGQPQPPQIDPAILKVKNDMTVGRYDVVMDTGPGYETKRLEAAESMIDLMKTPLGEMAAKVGADLILRNLDFPGADDLADRMMPMSEQGMKDKMESLPKDARGVVMAIYQNLQHAQQVIQALTMEKKARMDVIEAREKGATERAHIQAGTKVHDTEQWTQVERENQLTKAHTSLVDTHTRAHASIAVAEIGAAGQMLNTHVEAHHNKEAARELAAAAERAVRED
jgi:hypothetical protein